MKKLVFILLLFSGIMFSAPAKGEDVTLLLTVKAKLDQAEIRNKLRLGNWQNGKDGLDPLDVQAMTNGLFDAYSDIPTENGNSVYHLWWDIRSAKSSQEWKLVMKTPSSRLVVIDWQQVPFTTEKGSLWYTLIDPDTGIETRLEKGSGSLTLFISGSKTLIIKSRMQ